MDTLQSNRRKKLKKISDENENNLNHNLICNKINKIDKNYNLREIKKRKPNDYLLKVNKYLLNKINNQLNSEDDKQLNVKLNSKDDNQLNVKLNSKDDNQLNKLKSNDKIKNIKSTRKLNDKLNIKSANHLNDQSNEIKLLKKLKDQPKEIKSVKKLKEQPKDIKSANHLNNQSKEIKSVKKDNNSINQLNDNQINKTNKLNIIKINKLKDNQFEDVFLTEDDLIRQRNDKLNENKDNLIDLNIKSICRRRFKIDCEYVDFINEFGYRKNIQLVISKIFTYLDDKELMKSFCVSKKWNTILKENDYICKRRLNFIKQQNELKNRIGLENYPAVIKGEIKRSTRRRILGEMTNQSVLNC